MEAAVEVVVVVVEPGAVVAEAAPVEEVAVVVAEAAVWVLFLSVPFAAEPDSTVGLVPWEG